MPFLIKQDFKDVRYFEGQTKAEFLSDYPECVDYIEVAEEPPLFSKFDESDNVVFDEAAIVAVIRRIYNEKRTAEYKEGFTYDGNEYDSDGESPQLITGAATIARANPAYEVDWTLKDNTEVTLNATQVIEMEAAFFTHSGNVFETYRDLKNALENKTETQLRAIYEDLIQG